MKINEGTRKGSERRAKTHYPLKKSISLNLILKVCSFDHSSSEGQVKYKCPAFTIVFTPLADERHQSLHETKVVNQNPIKA